jgi:hypothetical protein
LKMININFKKEKKLTQVSQLAKFVTWS